VSNLEDRIAALEAEVLDLREKITDAHTLAAHADRDVAEFRDELRTQTRLINLTRLDMNALATELKADAAETKAGLAHIVRLLEQLGASPEE